MTLSTTMCKIKKAIHRVKHIDNVFSSDTTVEAKAHKKYPHSFLRHSKGPKTNQNNNGSTNRKGHFRIFRRSHKQEVDSNAVHLLTSSPALRTSLSSEKTNADSAVVLHVPPKPPKSILRAQTSTVKKSVHFSNTTEEFSHNSDHRPVNVSAATMTRLAYKISRELDTLNDMNEYTDALAYQTHYKGKESISDKAWLKKKAHSYNFLLDSELDSPLGETNEDRSKEVIKAKKRKDKYSSAFSEYSSSYDSFELSLARHHSSNSWYRNRQRKASKYWTKELKEDIESEVRQMQKDLASVIFAKISKNPYAYADLPHLQPEAFSDVLPQYLISDLVKKIAKIYKKCGISGCLENKETTSFGTTILSVHRPIKRWTQAVSQSIEVADTVKLHPSKLELTIANTNGLSILSDHKSDDWFNGRHKDDRLQLMRDYMSKKSTQYDDHHFVNELISNQELQLATCENEYLSNPCYETEMARCCQKWNLMFIYGAKVWLEGNNSLELLSKFLESLSSDKHREISQIESNWI